MSRLLILLMTALLTGSAGAADGDARIETGRLSEIVRILASDEFEGRAPGGPGEAKTVAYLADRFRAMGLEPAGTNGDWTQAVPLVHTRVQAPSVLAFSTGDDRQPLAQAGDIAVETSRPVDRVTIDRAPVVFVGFGVSAPERGWDDFGDMDLAGKLAVFLVNDPDFSAGPGEAVAGRFGGRRMTYYGRWTYKFEEAARRGAIAALVVHEDKAAGYGWNVASSAPGENFALEHVPGSPLPVLLQGWLHGDAAARLFARAGLDLDEQRSLARREDFQAFELQGITFSADVPVVTERIESHNVLARLPGTARPEETIMISAHWDAYGEGEPDAQGRTVRPGANDDALGTAGVLELARVLKARGPLQRSVVFALWTAEESGLLGSAAYAADPVWPVETTVANLTLDILQTAGPARDVILVGEGQSDLEDDLARAAARQGRVVTPENLPENGLFYRADHFSLARRGVPVLLIMAIAGGSDLVAGGRAAGDQWIADYIGNCYHQTCDAWSPDWDLRGAAQDVDLFRTIAEDLGNSERWPEWKLGSEFRAIRAASSARRTDPAQRWVVDFQDDFDSFDPANWQDQILWVNDEDQCYVRDGRHGTREVSDGTLKLRVVDIGEARPCDSLSKSGERHPDTRYVAGRIASKNRQEFARGRWTARLRTWGNGREGMFPAWWLLGARNNEPPVQEPDEDVCWPMTGSGEIDIFEHHGSGGAGRYASRMIRSLGHCDGGDWESAQRVISADLDEFHEYSVEWQGADLVFRLDGAETHRIPGGGDLLPEPMFAVLNYAKYSAGAMHGEWVMEVDWVRHEHRD